MNGDDKLPPEIEARVRALIASGAEEDEIDQYIDEALAERGPEPSPYQQKIREMYKQGTLGEEIEAGKKRDEAEMRGGASGLDKVRGGVAAATRYFPPAEFALAAPRAAFQAYRSGRQDEPIRKLYGEALDDVRGISRTINPTARKALGVGGAIGATAMLPGSTMVQGATLGGLLGAADTDPNVGAEERLIGGGIGALAGGAAPFIAPRIPTIVGGAGRLAATPFTWPARRVINALRPDLLVRQQGQKLPPGRIGRAFAAGEKKGLGAGVAEAFRGTKVGAAAASAGKATNKLLSQDVRDIGAKLMGKPTRAEAATAVRREAEKRSLARLQGESKDLAAKLAEKAAKQKAEAEATKAAAQKAKDIQEAAVKDAIAKHRAGEETRKKVLAEAKEKAAQEANVAKLKASHERAKTKGAKEAKDKEEADKLRKRLTDWEATAPERIRAAKRYKD